MNKMKADMMTKWLERMKDEKFREGLGVFLECF
jgi:hypothetical protein